MFKSKISGRAIAALATATAVCALVAAAVPVIAASQEGKEKIPAFASANYGWQTNNGDWQPMPAGMKGHGPLIPDPGHPFMANAEGGRLGKQPTLRIANTKDAVLKPWAAKFMADSNEEALTGKLDVPFAAQARCFPGAVPGQLLWPFEPMYWVQTPNEVWIMWQRDHLVRRIFLNREHSKNLKPSWYGESVGHYENGDTLVVDTIGLSTKMSFIDNFRTPHTEKEHVVERYMLSKDMKTVTAVVTVDDPDAFNEPIHMTQHWFRVDAPMAETVCAENNNDNNFFGQKLVPIPEEDHSPF